MEEDHNMAKAEPELLLNKSEVDRTFSFNKTQWSQEASQMRAPGWSLRVCDHESGAQVVGFDPSTHVGISVQPYFRNDIRLPEMVIIANYFPLGMLPPITNKLRNQMQSLAQKEIGEAYSVILGHEVINKLEIARRKGTVLFSWQLPSNSAFENHSDHPIRPHQHIRRNRQADLLGGFKIDHEFKLHRLLDGQVLRLCPFE